MAHPHFNITGTNGKTTTARLLAHTPSVERMMTTEGFILTTNWCSAVMLQAQKRGWSSKIHRGGGGPEAGGGIRDGLGYDRSDVAVITISMDPGQDDTLESVFMEILLVKRFS